MNNQKIIKQIVSILLFLLPASLFADNFPTLIEGETVLGIINLDDEMYKTYILEVEEDTLSIDLIIEGAKADLDIFIKWGDEIMSYDDIDGASEYSDFNETYNHSVLSEIPLRKGTYYVDIAYQLDDTPVINGRPTKKIPFKLTYRANVQEAIILEEGEMEDFTLLAEENYMRLFRVDVPAGAEALRLDLSNTRSDLDVLINEGTRVPTYNGADFLEEGTWGKEVVIINSRSEFPLQDDTYTIVVYSPLSEELPAYGTASISFTEEAPEYLFDIPEISNPSDPLDRAIASTVEIILENAGGTGCLVSDDGFIITNAHVIMGDNGEPEEKVIIAVNRELNRPPEELFIARVIRWDEDIDLALLKIAGGLYGQPLPRGYDFPYFNFGDTSELFFGDRLVFLGYPSIGANESRGAITYTQGVVAGFELNEFYGDYIKTDGEINSGNSGGAAVNDQFQLIGFPTFTTFDDAGQLGWITSIDFIPDDWIRIFR